MTKKTNKFPLLDYSAFISKYFVNFLDEVNLPYINKPKSSLKDQIKRLDTIKLTDKHDLITTAFIFNIEIKECFNRFLITIKLIDEIDTKNKQNKKDLLLYFVENFYNEYYIYTERVIKHLKTLKKKTIKKHIKLEIQKHLDEYVTNTSPKREIRNIHNHQKRYTDDKHGKLMLIDAFRSQSKPNDIENRWDKEFQIIKDEYSNTLNKEIVILYDVTNKTLNNICENIFNNVYEEL